MNGAIVDKPADIVEIVQNSTRNVFLTMLGMNLECGPMKLSTPTVVFAEHDITGSPGFGDRFTAQFHLS